MQRHHPHPGRRTRRGTFHRRRGFFSARAASSRSRLARLASWNRSITASVSSSERGEGRPRQGVGHPLSEAGHVHLHLVGLELLADVLPEDVAELFHVGVEGDLLGGAFAAEGERGRRSQGGEGAGFSWEDPQGGPKRHHTSRDPAAHPVRANKRSQTRWPRASPRRSNLVAGRWGGRSAKPPEGARLTRPLRGREHRQHVVGVLLPVGGQVEHTARCEAVAHQGDEGGLDQTPLVVPLLGPGIGKEDLHPGEGWPGGCSPPTRPPRRPCRRAGFPRRAPPPPAAGGRRPGGAPRCRRSPSRAKRRPSPGGSRRCRSRSPAPPVRAGRTPLPSPPSLAPTTGRSAASTAPGRGVGRRSCAPRG
ncbi:MAG: hypothetical protein KatS3mg124_2090 [Porticoccaceae bacterium]|nr:MAG: hypothetical protein KatS3mg124_2090 [Porticoccaceae bacterium]